MLPKEIEKTLRKLGDDGDKVRGAIERDFAAYAKEAEKDRGVGAIARSRRETALDAGRQGGGGMVPSGPDEDGFQARLTEVRERAKNEVEKRRADAEMPRRAGDDGSQAGGA